MTQPILFVRTDNDTFSVPHGYDPKAYPLAELKRWAKLAEAQPEGTSYFSASTEVTKAGIASKRYVTLANVTIPHDDTAAKEKIRTFLRNKLASIKTWPIPQSPDITTNQDLATWIQELSLPTTIAPPTTKRRRFIEPIEIVGVVVVFGITGILYHTSTGPQPPQQEQHVEASRKLLLAAIGDSSDGMKETLAGRFGAINSDTWKNGLGRQIPKSGGWPLDIFFPGLDQSPKNQLAMHLWGQNAASLRIKGSLKPLTACFDATSAIFDNKNRDLANTPFLDWSKDFAPRFGNNPQAALQQRIKTWIENDPQHRAAIEARYGCTTDPKPHTLLAWLKTCVEPLDFADTEFKKISEFGKQCRAVPFVD